MMQKVINSLTYHSYIRIHQTKHIREEDFISHMSAFIDTFASVNDNGSKECKKPSGKWKCKYTHNHITSLLLANEVNH